LKLPVVVFPPKMMNLPVSASKAQQALLLARGAASKGTGDEADPVAGAVARGVVEGTGVTEAEGAAGRWARRPSSYPANADPPAAMRRTVTPSAQGLIFPLFI
jgi:hypothetical protein